MYQVYPKTISRYYGTLYYSSKEANKARRPHTCGRLCAFECNKEKKRKNLPETGPTFLFLFTMSYINIVLNIIHTLYEGYIVSVQRMVIENRSVDPGSIQGSHRPISFIRIEHRTRANDIL